MAALNITERGDGYPLVFIHGFPFNNQIWDSFAGHFDRSFRVVTPDLPGFGKSAALSLSFSIEDVANAVLGQLKKKAISECALVGHSLGGYVALAMAGQEPGFISRFALFHSTAYADSAEKKDNRNKVVDFVRKNGAEAFTGGFINPLFADQKHPAIDQVRAIACKASEETVIGYTLAMRDRPDRTSVLREFGKPMLIITGDRDAGITTASVEEQAALSSDVKVHVLKDVAHMGMFEKPDESAAVLSRFLGSK
ncbi:MAG TPA: alpha/beta hydrolase [Chryseosolibacter sp.]|nr:alpha/beta hydrolase [Chryseosolibacter sp.]